MLVDGVVVIASGVELHILCNIYMIVYLSISIYSTLQYMLVFAGNLTKCRNTRRRQAALNSLMGGQLGGPYRVGGG